MDTTESLGAVAHSGGLLVRRPELTVGVVRAVSGLSALEIELLARRPLDRRSAAERQRDIRDGLSSQPAVASRRLLPAYDEGVDLRVGWLDHAGHAQWEFATSCSSSDGDYFLGTSGPTYRAVFRLPPTFDEISLVLAWPEIGFPETVITVPLPDRTTVERATTSIWQAPLDIRPVPEGVTHHADRGHGSPAIEAGTNVAPPRVLHRRDHRVAVVLTRLTAMNSMLSMELLSIAKGDSADAVNAHAFPPPRPTSGALDDPAQIRATGPGASVAVIQGHEALWIRPGDSTSSGGNQTFSCLQEFTLNRPHDDLLDLIVAWPLAGLHDVRVHIPLNPT
ncbi:hypothetical protein [Kibdelosporangium aridum]|uniref:Uncharacterized protein n=1 Tax=Kibdelosporangium aridum TaxID=2030 RepID=A0A1W2FU24_KIBAR|nr:hypothetical protein [Kibdelosporangium aridum]SMD25420.1 hypothetical protein SAMN05661093_09106 [Kibdelosporangium aridum]